LPFTEAQVSLLGNNRAEVIIPGELTTSDGQKAPSTWKVRLWMDPVKHRWQAASAMPPPPTASVVVQP
jgi:hypothetical protein